MRVDIGVCEPSMPVLILGAVFLVVSTLLGVVATRLWILGHIAGDDATESGRVVMKVPSIAGAASVVAAVSSNAYDEDASSLPPGSDEGYDQQSAPASASGSLPDQSPPLSARVSNETPAEAVALAATPPTSLALAEETVVVGVHSEVF